MPVMPDPNPWKIFKNGNLNAQVADHKTAERVMKVLSCAFPDATFESRYQGKTVSMFHDGGKVIDG